MRLFFYGLTKGSFIRRYLYGWDFLLFFRNSLYGLRLTSHFLTTQFLLPLRNGNPFAKIARYLLKLKPCDNILVKVSYRPLNFLRGKSFKVLAFNSAYLSIFYSHSFPMILKHMLWSVVLLEDLTTLETFNSRVSSLVLYLIFLFGVLRVSIWCRRGLVFGLLFPFRFHFYYYIGKLIIH